MQFKEEKIIRANKKQKENRKQYRIKAMREMIEEEMISVIKKRENI